MSETTIEATNIQLFLEDRVGCSTEEFKTIERYLEVFVVQALQLMKEIKLPILPVNLSVSFVTSEAIQVLNKDYRGKDKATDVLSFPIFEDLRSDPSELKGFQEVELGDIVICESVARKQSKEFSVTYPEEVLHLVVHGFLHLLGFDHELSESEEILMEKYEQQLVSSVAINL